MTVVLIVSQGSFSIPELLVSISYFGVQSSCCLFRQLRALSTALFGFVAFFLFFLTVFAFWKFLLGGAGIESK